MAADSEAGDGVVEALAQAIVAVEDFPKPGGEAGAEGGTGRGQRVICMRNSRCDANPPLPFARFALL